MKEEDQPDQEERRAVHRGGGGESGAKCRQNKDDNRIHRCFPQKMTRCGTAAGCFMQKLKYFS